MNNFFNQVPGQAIEWFGLTHILIIVFFISALITVLLFGNKLYHSKYEMPMRFIIIGLVFLFEWRVFENRFSTYHFLDYLYVQSHYMD